MRISRHAKHTDTFTLDKNWRSWSDPLGAESLQMETKCKEINIEPSCQNLALNISINWSATLWSSPKKEHSHVKLTNLQSRGPGTWGLCWGFVGPFWGLCWDIWRLCWVKNWSKSEPLGPYSSMFESWPGWWNLGLYDWNSRCVFHFFLCGWCGSYQNWPGLWWILELRLE